jgi:hypothetical protein
LMRSRFLRTLAMHLHAQMCLDIMEDAPTRVSSARGVELCCASRASIGSDSLRSRLPCSIHTLVVMTTRRRTCSCRASQWVSRALAVTRWGARSWQQLHHRLTRARVDGRCVCKRHRRGRHSVGLWNKRCRDERWQATYAGAMNQTRSHPNRLRFAFWVTVFTGPSAKERICLHPSVHPIDPSD